MLFLHINGTKGLMPWLHRVQKFGNPLIQGKNLSKLLSYIYSRWTRWSNEMLEQGQSFLNLIQTIDASFHSSKKPTEGSYFKFWVIFKAIPNFKYINTTCYNNIFVWILLLKLHWNKTKINKSVTIVKTNSNTFFSAIYNIFLNII